MMSVNVIGRIYSHLVLPRRFCASSESTMLSNSVRVAAAQMTSINDLASNFATCSRLVKEAASAGAKLLCFPEAFSYIGARDRDSVSIAEPLHGPRMQKYCSLARYFMILCHLWN
ncbi:Deaminated glutathione amidase, chloroplastic/cytosolic [Stylosanthes scabra]|uniref:Deaminated glutathione amidase, chloroplastic/cytosolic n=1 Tax=Stylosanthes scabra TaxID=79078 RepID=A0ABU6WI26_9FABA|nr:Deaminated glutathione amidase, chloroplastic/cytosolic [Stylosanthes scabra]